jgi:ribose transport system permease protein
MVAHNVRLALLGRYGTLAALLVIIAGFSAASPGVFPSLANFLAISQQMALLAIIAVGATFVMIVAEFDLAISAVASFAGIFVVTLLHQAVPLPLALGLTLLAAAGVGAASGLLVARFRVPSFIATLAISTIVSGLTFWISGGATLFGHLPAGFLALSRGAPGGVPALSLWMAGLGLAAAWVAAQTEWGRRLYAIGGNREAAALAGVAVARDTLSAFIASALLAAICGILLTARLGSAHPTAGDGFLLEAYAAIFLGTTAFKEGEPNVFGTLLGAAIIAVLANGLTILNVPSYMQDILTGAIIIISVLLRALRHR